LNDGSIAEGYWAINEARRQERLSKFFPFFVDDKPSDLAVEGQVLDRIKNNSWVMKAGGRRYQLVFDSSLPQAQIDKLDLTKFDDYDSAWHTMIVGLLPLAWAPSANAPRPAHLPFAYIESVDLSPSMIVEEFSRLKIDYDIASATSTLGDKLLEKLSTNLDAGRDYIRDTVAMVRELKESQSSSEQKIRALKERAQRIGYHLATGLTMNGKADDEIYVPTGPGTTRTDKVPIGRLYLTEERFATYTVRQSAIQRYIGIGTFWPGDLLNPIPTIPLIGGPLGGLGFGPHSRRVDRDVTVSVRYLGLKEAEMTQEPWEIKRQIIQAAGFQCEMAELTTSGYVVEDGTPVRELLARCAVDEDYRERLTIFFPIYQERLSGGLVKIRYMIAIRPEPGIDPVGFPSIYCDESLSYRAEWKGIELGELLHGIGLAPGEERNVTISRSVEQKTEQVQSISSVLDVTSSQKLDLSSSLQDTISQDKNSKSTSNWNVNASVSIGPFGGGGGGGGTQESSVRDFAESIKKSAMQSTREMRTNQRQEVKSSTTTSTTVSTTESTESTFKNINQGATLNILFYDVRNIFSAGFFLDELGLAYRPAVELVAGTGVHDLITFKLSDLATAVGQACQDAVISTGALLFDRSTLERRILRAAVKTILAEYVDPDRDDGKETDVNPLQASETANTDTSRISAMFSTWFQQSSGLLSAAGVRPDDLKDVLATLSNHVERSSAADECAKYVRLLGELERKVHAFMPHTLIVPSSAVYADSVVGAMPATEPYSERMREAEVRKQLADADKKMADALLTRQIAASMNPLRNELQIARGNLPGQSGAILEVISDVQFVRGYWVAFCDGELVAQLRVDKSTAVLRFAAQTGTQFPTGSGHLWLVFSPATGRVVKVHF
jgi:hypothetical protein